MVAVSPEAKPSAVKERAADAALLCGWLRDALRGRLARLREEHDAVRTELDALLEPFHSTPVATAPPVLASLTDLATRFDLRTDEQGVLSVLLAAALEPSLGRALGLLCDSLGRGAPTWEAVTRVLDLPRTHRLTADDGLSRWRLISLVDDDALRIDAVIEARLLGRSCRDAALVEHLAVIPPREPLPDWPVDAVAEKVRRAIAAGARGARLWMRGPVGSGRRTLFAAIARSLGLIATTVSASPQSPSIIRAAIRLAWLDDLAPLFTDRVELPGDLPVPPLVAWLEGEPPAAPEAGVVDLTVRLPPLERSTRGAAWKAIVPAFSGWAAADQDALIDAWASRPGQLVRVATAGVATAAEAGALLRSEAGERMEGHADILDTPFDWEDLVVPAPLLASLKELAFEARALPALLDDPRVGRLFPHGRSVIALLSGPPGTGKTMAAQVIARAIGLPLFRVDLSRMVSKYIGETSQNLSHLLDAARDTDAVVLFDEADALFGRRTEVHDAHDRYANTDTDYLLQALDSWPGIAILATNKRGNIDPAFLRRMRMVLDFARPEAGERRQIWARLCDALLADRDHEVTAMIDRVADAVELSGAQIKGAVLSARLGALRAQSSVATAHMIRGIERELEKDGRNLSARDKKRLLEPPRPQPTGD